jgi:hypothetical protein
MTVDRDVLWVDLLQFDPPSADRVWEGDLHDPDAPGWYTDLGSIIHRARGPAEPHELVDEPDVVATMRRASLGATIAALPRRPGARSVGRLVAMKATAAATTASLVGVAAAATTGIVATVVVPAIADKVRPVVEEHVVPVEAITERPSVPTAGTACRPRSDFCIDPSSPVVVDLPAAAPADPAEVAPATVAAPATAESVAGIEAPLVEQPVVEAPVEPGVTEPVPTELPPEPVDPAPPAAQVDPPAADPDPGRPSASPAAPEPAGPYHADPASVGPGSGHASGGQGSGHAPGGQGAGGAADLVRGAPAAAATPAG